MSEHAKKLIAERARIWSEMSSLIDTAAAANRSLDSDELVTYKRAEEDLDRLTQSIKIAEEHEGRARQYDAPPVDDGRTPTGSRQQAEEAAELRQKAFAQWLRRGSDDMEPEMRQHLGALRVPQNEARALGIGTTTAGGYFVPQGFRQTIVETLKYFGAVRSEATVIETDSGQVLPWPTNNDTGNVGAILSENSQISQQDVVLGQAQLGAYVYTSKLVLVSYQLLQDSAFDLETFLARKLGQRIARIQNQHFTTGTGTSQPLGLATSPTVGVTLPTGNTTTITYAGLIQLIHSVDPAYRYGGNQTTQGGMSGEFMLSDTALSAIRQLTDSQNRPLWQPSLMVGVPDSLLGFEYEVNNDMPVPAANALSVLFGDFEAGYVVRDVTGVNLVRLDERYADFLQVGFFAYARSDATVQDAAAYKALKNSAT